MIHNLKEVLEYIEKDEVINFNRKLTFLEKLYLNKYKFLFFFRFSNYFYYKKRYFLYKIFVFLYNYYRLKFNVDIKPDLKIGEGFKIPHIIGIVINSKVKIGKNCIILQNVTIGNKNGENDVPTIGNNVFIGAGAVLIGDIRIGNNVKIGANAVVLNDIPDNSIVIGVPGRILKKGNN